MKFAADIEANALAGRFMTAANGRRTLETKRIYGAEASDRARQRKINIYSYLSYRYST